MDNEVFLAYLNQSFSAKKDKHGRLCIVTPFIYPDDDLIEVFVEELDGGTIRVSDLGETSRRMATTGKGKAFYKALKRSSDIISAVGKKEDVIDLTCQVIGHCYMLSRVEEER